MIWGGKRISNDSEIELSFVTQWHRHILPLKLPRVHHHSGSGVPHQAGQRVGPTHVQDWQQENDDWHKEQKSKYNSLIVVHRHLVRPTDVCSCRWIQFNLVSRTRKHCVRPHLTQHITVCHHVSANKYQRQHDCLSKEEGAYLKAFLRARGHPFDAFRNAGPLCLAQTAQTFILLNLFTLVTTLNAVKHFPPHCIVIVSIINIMSYHLPPSFIATFAVVHFGSLLRKEFQKPGFSSSWTWIHSLLSKKLFHKNCLPHCIFIVSIINIIMIIIGYPGNKIAE